MNDEQIREVLGRLPKGGLYLMFLQEWGRNGLDKRLILHELAERQAALEEIVNCPIVSVHYEQRRKGDIGPQPIESVCDICRKMQNIARRFVNQPGRG